MTPNIMAAMLQAIGLLPFSYHSITHAWSVSALIEISFPERRFLTLQRSPMRNELSVLRPQASASPGAHNKSGLSGMPQVSFC